MSDLSWLNPTPHTIAVYASRPLSPVAAQHSLPSGRYSLLGPDFHRLDRTSLRLAHSFNHLVGAAEQRGRQVEPERLARLEIDCQLEFDRKLHRKLARLLALEDAIGVARRAAVTIETVVSVGQQATKLREDAVWINGGKPIARRQRCDRRSMVEGERIRHHDQAAVRLASLCSNHGFELGCLVNRCSGCRHGEDARGGPEGVQPMFGICRRCRVEQHCDPRHARCTFLQQLKPFTGHCRFQICPGHSRGRFMSYGNSIILFTLSMPSYTTT